MPRTLVTTTYLEQNDRPGLSGARNDSPGYALMRSELPCPELNRFLYTTVGSDWYWYERVGWSYQNWLAWLDREDVQTWVAYRRGTPAGYFELERQTGDSVEIAYFGLVPQFIGQGLGGALLTDAIEAAWDFGAKRVWVHTCTLDHPSALGNYRARGFEVFKEESQYEMLPDEPLLPWRGY